MIRFSERRKHDRLRGLLSSYIDGEVSDGEAREVEQHLARCSECATELESLRTTSSLLRRLPQLQLPRSFALAEAPVPARRASPAMWTTSLATSAAALLLVVLLLGDLLGIITQSETETRRFAGMEAPAAPLPAAPAAPAPAAPAPRQPAAPAQPAAAPTAAQAPAAPAAPQAAPAQPAPAAPAPAPAPTEKAEQPAIAAAEAPAAEGAPGVTVEQDMIVKSALPEETASAGYGTATPEPEVGIAAMESTAMPEAAPMPTQEQVPAPSPEAAARVAGPPGAPAAESEPETIRSAGDEEPEPVEEAAAGVELPLRQLEIGIGALLGVLLVVTAWMARRRSG